MTRYERFCVILATALSACLGNNYALIASALDTILANQPGPTTPDDASPVLATIINDYDKPVGQMVADYCHYVSTGSGKPEWLDHAGL
jgi:hypothetical protein